ncbi:retrotransposon protein, putative, ty1-copia subclass [Tanacetum coccineum]
MVLGIAPVAIIYRQLPVEYTITSRSTDVVAMAQPVQNINHSAFRSMFEREKLSRNNFNEWFHQLKLVLRVEKKMFVIKQPLPVAPAANSEAQVLSQWNAVYDTYNEVACLILGKEGKPVAAYVIQMKGYVDQLERLGYMLPQDLIVGLILNGLTKDFAGFVRNYNMHNMRKTIGELHAMLIEYEKGLPKKAKTPQLLKKKKEVGSASSSGIFTIELFAFPNKSWVYDTGCGTHICITKSEFREARKLKQGALSLYIGNGVRAQAEAIGSYDLVLPNGLMIYLDNFSKNNVFYFNAIPSNGIYEIDMHNLVPNVNSIYNVSTKRAKHNMYSTYLWHYCLAHISKKRIEKLQKEGLLKSTDDELFDQCGSCLSGKMTRKSFPHRPERATNLFGIIHTDVCGPLRHVSIQESETRILNMAPTKKVDKTPYELWYGKVPNLSYLKWIDAMNAEIQSMMDNMVWVLVDLPPGCKTVGTAYYDNEIWQIDVKTAFLNGYLDEDIYMQASRSWNKRFDEEIKRFGFAQNLDEPCVYQKASGSNITFLILYVDDIIIIGNHVPSLQSVKGYLVKCFAMKDLGEEAFILGLKIYRDRSKRLIELSQNAYMDKILKRYKMDNSKRGHISMQERLDLNKTQSASTPKEVKRMQNVPYASVVGSIIFETDRDDTKSQTRYDFILNGSAVDWKSSKQSTTAMSATESKYIAASKAAMEAA